MNFEFGQDILKLNPAAKSASNYIEELARRQPVFILTVAYTATVQLPGVSGAGINSELRELTAAADAEILAFGRAQCLPGGVPSNPTGAPGPSIITRAAFNLLPGLTYRCVDAGLKVPVEVPGLFHIAGAGPGQAVTTGQALGPDNGRAQKLFEAGLKLGTELGQAYAEAGYLILAESVPGGTTTALGLLLALGLDAEQRVSSSMPDNAHTLKLAAVQTGLAAIGRSKGDFVADPLGGAAALGDPMQPVVAGIALAASPYCPVLLGGGTQMAAVHALLGALWRRPPPEFEKKIRAALFSNIGLATTRWVSADPTADLAGLGDEITERFKLPEVGYYSANLDFGPAHYPPMQLYEQGYVKEGVGAGAAALATMLATGLSAAEMLPYIEQVYEELCLGQPPNN